jgi:putative polyhydroxyalkanoate system protein
MNSIDIRRKHEYSAMKARKIVEELAENMSRKHGVSFHWDKHTLFFERRGIKGVVHLLPEEIHLRAELGFLMSPFKSGMEDLIERFLDQHIPKNKNS